MGFRLVPFILLLVPIAEIAVFILVGQYIGLFPTLGLILATAILGTILLRIQGFGILRRLTEETDAGRVPGREMVHGAMIVIAGILLITPGFITDTLGFLLFIPAVRDGLWALLKTRMTIVSNLGGFQATWPRSGSDTGAGGTGRPSGPVVDLDDAEYQRRSNPDSPWNGKSIDQDS